MARDEITWVKVDHGFPEHPKITGLEKDARLWADALALWLAGACYCRRAGTGGFIADERLPRLTPLSPRRAVQVANALVEKARTSDGEAGLWERVEGGWTFHDWNDYGPGGRGPGSPRDRHPAEGSEGVSKAALRKRRERDRKRDTERDSHAQVTRDSERDSDRDNQRDRSVTSRRDLARTADRSGPVRSEEHHHGSEGRGPSGRAREARPGGGGSCEVLPFRARIPADLADAQGWLKRHLDDAWLSFRGCSLTGEDQALRDATRWLWERSGGVGERFVEVAADFVRRWISEPWTVENRLKIRNPSLVFSKRLVAIANVIDGGGDGELVDPRIAIQAELREIEARRLAILSLPRDQVDAAEEQLERDFADLRRRSRALDEGKAS